MQEQRKHPRKSIALVIAFRAGSGERCTANCHDVSLGGMFIETSAPAAFGTPITVFIQFAGMKTESTIPATVRWTNPTGMGVQFGMMGARDTHALTTLIA